MYDITNRNTFDRIGKYHMDIMSIVPETTLILLGNKYDLIENNPSKLYLIKFLTF